MVTAKASIFTAVEAALPTWIVLADDPLPILILPVFVSAPILMALSSEASIVIAPVASRSNVVALRSCAADAVWPVDIPSFEIIPPTVIER